MSQALLPCPFCGKLPDIDDPDTLYPSGSGWKQHERYRSYHNRREVPPEQWCYSVNCTPSGGGCGAEMHADSEAEAIAAWNQRA